MAPRPQRPQGTPDRPTEPVVRSIVDRVHDRLVAQGLIAPQSGHGNGTGGDAA